ncbi:hypothetical protein JCM21900_004061 [Sporobolomyces salmonicolor]
MAPSEDRTQVAGATTIPPTPPAAAPAVMLSLPSCPTPLPTDSHLSGADNYSVWQLQMRGLVGIDAWRLMTASLPRPGANAGAGELAQWDRLNEFAVSSIIISCQQHVVHTSPTARMTPIATGLLCARHSLRQTHKAFSEVLSALKAAEVDLDMVYSSHLLAPLPPALDSLQTTISVSNPVALPTTDALLALIRNKILHPFARGGGIGGIANALIATGVGSLCIQLHNGRTVTIKNALLVKGLSTVLILSGQLWDLHGIATRFAEHATLTRNGTVVATGSRTKGSLYLLNGVVARPPTMQGATALLASTSVQELTMLHRHFAHLSERSLRVLVRSGQVTGLKVEGAHSRAECNVCQAAHATCLPFPSSDSLASHPLELVHSDVLSVDAASLAGKRYVVTFVDNFSRRLWVEPLDCKSDVFEVFKRFKAAAETESGRKLQRFRSDNGGEYSSRAFRAYLDEHGIAFKSPRPYSPASNGVAERVNRSILEGIHAMLLQAGADKSLWAGADKSLWAEALLAFVFVKNHSPHAALNSKVPVTVWHSHPVRVDMLRVWGCHAWHTLSKTKSKLDARAVPLVFVGYDGDTRAYRLLDPESKRMVRSRDTRFQEDLFPLALASSHAALEDDMGAHGEAFSLPSRDPRNHREVLTDVDSAGWLDGEKGEFLSLLNDYKVFHLVDRSSIPPTAKILGGRFHYRRKGYGKTRALKVRLVAQGYNQRPGLDFRETFAPVAKFTSIRVLLALAAQQRMHIQQADVDKAYLHADLNEELYMRVPDGVDGPNWNGKVLKLDRALCGLKQAGRAWNAKIHATLECLRYGRTISDICVYVRCEGGNYHYIALYIDDLLFLSHSQSEIDQVKGGLREQYGIKDLGDASCILGIDLVCRPDGSVFLSQRAYLETVLARLSQLECHTAPTSMIPNQQLIPAPPDSADEPSLRHRYLQAVGSLMYAMLGTRPDLAHSVGVLGRFSSRPSPVHWAAVVRVCQYIKGSLDIGLLHSPSDCPIGGFSAYSDSDWGACPTTSWSTMGFAFMLAGGPISWSSRLQPRVTASSTEAEYLGLAHAGKEAIFLSQLLGELGLPLPLPLLLCGDNQGANALARDPQFHDWT